MPLWEKWWEKAKCWWAGWFQEQGPDPEILTHLFFCHVISSSLRSLVLFSHLLFPLFFLAEVNWHIRPWSHLSYLALLCTGSPVAYVPPYSSNPLFAAWTLGHHSQQSHEFNLVPWVGVREGMLQNGRKQKYALCVVLFFPTSSALCLLEKSGRAWGKLCKFHGGCGSSILNGFLRKFWFLCKNAVGNFHYCWRIGLSAILFTMESQTF